MSYGSSSWMGRNGRRATSSAAPAGHRATTPPPTPVAAPPLSPVPSPPLYRRPPPSSMAQPAGSALAMQLVESIRAKVHAAYGPTVSCADITMLSTRDAVVVSGGLSFPVPRGNLGSLSPVARSKVLELPAPSTTGVADLVRSFATRGLGDVVDLVALSGAHTVGRSQCGSFTDRTARMDDTFSRKLAANCTKRPAALQNLDVVTPDLFDNGYYHALTFNQGVFTSHMALIKNRTTTPIVRQFTLSKDAFFAQFAKSMAKLAAAPKPAGNVGEIRRNSCFRTNAQRVKTVVDVEEDGFAASA